VLYAIFFGKKVFQKTQDGMKKSSPKTSFSSIFKTCGKPKGSHPKEVF
jgi:hypothetical protein